MSDNDDKNTRKGLRDIAKKILKDDAGEHSLDPKELFSSIVQLSDKARTETVRLMAKEVRGYLEALEIKDDIHEILTSYSLDVSASFKLSAIKPSDEDSVPPSDGGDSD
jgi:hypothetical protein